MVVPEIGAVSPVKGLALVLRVPARNTAIANAKGRAQTAATSIE
jgi:hypothetical protein